MFQLRMITFNPPNPKEGAYIQRGHNRFVTIYNSIIDTYGIYKVEEDWSGLFWTPPKTYIYPTIDWESIWKEMDYCSRGYMRTYFYSESQNGPEIHFTNAKL